MIKYDVHEGAAEILLDSAPVNGITNELLDQLMARLSEAGADPRVRAIVLGSAIPGRFCGGLDLRLFRRGTPPQVHEIVNRLYFDLFNLNASLPKPIIGAITGAVRGGGMSIAITCDMLVAAEDSSFGYPEMEVGLLPAIHYNHLPRQVGRQRAFDLLFTGRVFDTQEAMAMGLVARSAPASEVLATAHELAAVFVERVAPNQCSELVLGGRQFLLKVFYLLPRLILAHDGVGFGHDVVASDPQFRNH